MTIEEMRESNKVLLTPEEASSAVNGLTAQAIRVAAHQAPDLLGFPVVVAGSRTYIPRIPFLRFLGVGADIE